MPTVTQISTSIQIQLSDNQGYLTLHSYQQHNNIMQNNHKAHQRSDSLLIDDPLLPRNAREFPQHLQSILSQIEAYLGGTVQFELQQVAVNERQHIMTILISSSANSQRTFYLGHGFGGTSLMYFPNFQSLLKHGNILLWQLRGMGVSHKLKDYRIGSGHARIKEFFAEGLHAVFNHFRHPKVVLMCHSFSGYITMNYLLQQPHIHSIEQVILLSPIGITSKNLDYKDRIRSCSDVKNLLLAKFGWSFKLSYKSPLRTICSCCKFQLLTKGFGCLPLSVKQRQICVELFMLLIELPNGTDNLFFRCFHPRVLPYQSESIQELLESNKYEYKYNTTIYYGGEKDWVDKQGAKILAQTHPNIKVSMQPEYGHMMPLYPVLLQKIIHCHFGLHQSTN